MSRELDTFAQPSLPEPGPSYNPGFFAQHNKVLRLFFNRVVATFNALLGQDGGSLLESPSGAFYSLVNQTAAVINTAYAVTFDNVSERRVTLASSSQVTVSVKGLYSVQARVQFDKVAGGGASAWIWLRKNGADIAGTTAQYEVTGGGIIDDVIGTYLVSLEAEDYIELMWAASSTAVLLQAQAAAAPVPAAASAILNVTFASMVRP